MDRRLWRYATSGLFLLLALTMSGCNFTQPPFEQMTDNISGAFSAASTTLTYQHQGRLTRLYTTSSFENYANELNGLDQQLPSQQGAPDRARVQRLISFYQKATQAVENPCLESSCHWQEQVLALNQASKAFQEASGA
jgi:hypothetical protein